MESAYRHQTGLSGSAKRGTCEDDGDDLAVDVTSAGSAEAAGATGATGAAGAAGAAAGATEGGGKAFTAACRTPLLSLFNSKFISFKDTPNMTKENTEYRVVFCVLSKYRVVCLFKHHLPFDC